MVFNCQIFTVDTHMVLIINGNLDEWLTVFIGQCMTFA